jgi:hypothetical protein
MTSTSKRINLNKVLTPVSDGEVKRRLEVLNTQLESGELLGTSRIAAMRKRFPERFKSMPATISPVAEHLHSNKTKEKPALKPERYFRTAKPRNALFNGKLPSAKLDAIKK